MGKGTDIHEDFDRSETIKPGSDRDFGLVFAASFVVLPVLSCRAAGHRWPWWLDTAAVTLAIAMTRPALPGHSSTLDQVRFAAVQIRWPGRAVSRVNACVSWKRRSPTFPELLRRTRTTLPFLRSV